MEHATYKNGNVKAVVDRYRYPLQEENSAGKAELRIPGNIVIGSISDHDRRARTIDIKKTAKTHTVSPTAVYQAIVYGSDVQQVQGLLRFAATPDAINCGTDLLFRRTPRFVPDTFAAQAGESTAPNARCASPHGSIERR